MAGRLEGKVAIVTGGASGIGRATAVLFCREGACVLIGDLDRERGPAVAASLGSAGRARFYAADLSRSEDAERLVASAVEAFGSLSILVNAVGASGRRLGDGPVADCAEEAWDYVLAANLKSVFLCSKYAIPAMRATGGAIVNLSSVLGLVGDPLFTTHAYAASKGGIISLTRAMAVHYAPERIRVNALCPGLIDTPMSARASGDPQVRAALPGLHLLTGKLGRPEDVAEAALFLASDAAAFITGCILPVDGGWTAR
jgi:meso-butanediol dehydrogenase/(S,S)-butanediol dehydrogenase/diacetyl reductase